MKDEIKEILDMLEFSNDSVMWCDKVTLNTKQSHLLLDYITNLQDYKSRIKKAIEYINKNKNKTIAPYGDNEDTDYEICLFEEDIAILLKLLQGVGKDE